MGELWGIIASLATGGKFLGLTLPQILAILEGLRQEEPAVEKLIKDATPLVQKFWIKLQAAAHQPPPTIPGYGPDGGVIAIHNPDAHK